MAYDPAGTSVVAFQSDPTKLQASVTGNVGVTNFPATQAISGSITALQGTNPWQVQLTSGSIATTVGNSSVQLVGGTAMIGSVAAYQGAKPWDIAGSVVAFLGNSTNASIITVGGSTGNSSVMLTQGINTIGSVTAIQGTNPWTVQLSSGSVITTGGNSSVQVVGAMPPQSVSGVGTFNINGSIAGTYTEKNTAASVTGLAMLFKADNSSSVMSTPSPNTPLPVVGSVSGNVGISGNVTVNPASVVFVSPQSVSGVGTFVVGDSTKSIDIGSGFPGGDGAAVGNGVKTADYNLVYNGSNWDRWRGNSSIGALVSTGASSVITVLQTPSIVGTYAEDSAHTSGDKGLFALQVRNDTMSSITSADGDYSPQAVGPIGEVISANAPITKWVQGTASILNVAQSVAVLAAPGANLFNYVTGVQLANASANNITVQFNSGQNSIIGYVPAPANGGAVFTIPNAWKGTANLPITASVSGLASILISMSGFTSKGGAI